MAPIFGKSHLQCDLLVKSWFHENGYLNTVWKFHDFAITQILHELGDSRSAKFAILAHLEALNLGGFLWIFAILKAEIYLKIKI